MDARVLYKAEEFDANAARNGALCIMVKRQGTSSPARAKSTDIGDDDAIGDDPIVTIAPPGSEEEQTEPSDSKTDMEVLVEASSKENPETMAKDDLYPSVYVSSKDAESNTVTWAKNTYYGGVGICRVVNNTFYFTVDSITHAFNAQGMPLSDNAVGWCLKLAVPQVNTSLSGSTVKSKVSSVESRGNVTGILTGNTEADVVVDNLNARDQFAVHALKGLFSSIPNPSSLSSNEINFYCNTAYKWAAGMMTSAAETRATVSQSSTETKKENVGTLDTNTEKLLNNLIIELGNTNARLGSVNTELARTNEAATESHVEGEETVTTTTYSERVSIPALISFLEGYTAHIPKEGETKTTVGLDDLINAIKGISISGGGVSNGEGSVSGNGNVTVSSMPSLAGTMQVGDTGLGRDVQHPFYVSTTFPSRDKMVNIWYSNNSDSSLVMTDVLTFNSSGTAGYSTVNELGKAIIARLEAADKTNIYQAIEGAIDDRIQLWLDKVRVDVGGTEYPLEIPDAID